MCSGLKGLLGPILTIAGTAIGGPLGGAAGAGLGSAINGGSFGQDLLSAGTAGIGAEVAPVLGNAFAGEFPETASSLGIGGGANSLTDLFGQTTGGGSLMGPGTLGGAISNGADSIGNLFNPTTISSTDVGSGLQDSFNPLTSSDSSSPTSVPAISASAPAATAPTVASSSFLPAASTGAQGGGSGGGGFSISPDTEFSSTGAVGNDLNNQFTQGIINPENTILASGGNIGGTSLPTPNMNITGGNMSSIPSLSSGLLGNGTNTISGLLRAGMMGGLNNPNNKGYDAQITAGQNIQDLYNPFVQTGTQANTTLANLLGENGTAPGAQTAAQANFANTPGYQFALQQGENALNANAAATGQTLSGNNQQAVQNYGTGLANQTYNQYVNNLQNQIGTGVNAAGGVASGLLGTANAQAGKGAAAANNQNATIGGVANSLFPQNSLMQLMGLLGGNQAYAY